MKSIFETAIKAGKFGLPTMLSRLNYHHVNGNLTDGEHAELCALARGTAKAAASVDVEQKLMDLDARLRALEQAVGSGSTGDDAPDYVSGKWYYQGDRVTYAGSVYTCTAPTGVACVWSPADYPAYWEQA